MVYSFWNGSSTKLPKVLVESLRRHDHIVSACELDSHDKGMVSRHRRSVNLYENLSHDTMKLCIFSNCYQYCHLNIFMLKFIRAYLQLFSVLPFW